VQSIAQAVTVNTDNGTHVRMIFTVEPQSAAG